VKTATIINRKLLGTGIILTLIFGSLQLDRIPLSLARPPKNVRTIEDFQVWKNGHLMGRGTFQNSGVTYTVMLAPAGRYLASGPSAYLFDTNGRFVDWTADMGDFYTVTNRFNLTGGAFKNITHDGRTDK
jgi:hypothetical protein